MAQGEGRFQWEDYEIVWEEEYAGLRFQLPRQSGQGETAEDYRVEVWHVKHGFLGAVSNKTLGRIIGRARRYAEFLPREEYQRSLIGSQEDDED